MIERALIIRQPHIGRILAGQKIWEMRSTKTQVRGRIALIEGGSGLITGEACLVDSLPLMPDGWQSVTRLEHCIDDDELLKRWPYPWVLANAKQYAKPIPYKHPKGAVIWVKLDAETAAKCEAAK